MLFVVPSVYYLLIVTDARKGISLNIAVWVVSGLLALSFLAAGGSKAFPSKPVLEARFFWARAIGIPATRSIGVAELVGALGLILPTATGILPILAPIAAACLLVIMVGAVVTHARDREWGPAGLNVALVALLAFVAIARFSGV